LVTVSFLGRIPEGGQLSGVIKIDIHINTSVSSAEMGWACDTNGGRQIHTRYFSGETERKTASKTYGVAGKRVR